MTVRALSSPPPPPPLQFTTLGGNCHFSQKAQEILVAKGAKENFYSGYTGTAAVLGLPLYGAIPPPPPPGGGVTS